MRGTFLVALGVLASVSHAQTPSPVPTDLTRVQASADTDVQGLQSFVCDEKIQRFRGTLDRSRPQVLDTIDAALSFENGTEHYSGLRQNGIPLSDLATISGAWSEGEFGTLLHQTGQLMRAEGAQLSNQDETTLQFGFDVTAEDSPWMLVIDGKETRLGFHTDFWVAKESGRIIRVRREANDFPKEAGISGIEWDVSLATFSLSGHNWLLPSTAGYAVSYAAKNRREWNQITFANYRRYGSKAELRFDTR